MLTTRTFAAHSALLSLTFGALLACGGERMSLGANDLNEDVETEPDVEPCGDGTVHRDVQIARQRDLDALLGCEIIEGDVRILQPPDSDEELSLAPLASLREVTGHLSLERLHSLAGLEALEQVGGLDIFAIGSEDLTALSHLRRVFTANPANGSTGAINIGGCANLLSLAGLERLSIWSDLNIADSALETLQGLSVPALAQQLTLSNLPSLRNLRGLEFARTIRYVSVIDTGVESLDGFGLREADNLVLVHNPALQSLHGLAQLSVVGSLVVQDNDALLSTSLPPLSSVQSLSITGNDALTELSGGSGLLATGYSSPNADPLSTPVWFATDVFEVGDNTRLTRIDSPDFVANLQLVSIWGNPALSDLTFNRLTRATNLYIVNNASLRAVSAPALERVGDLQILNNPQLSTSAFAKVQTFTRTMSGNAEATSAP